LQTPTLVEHTISFAVFLLGYLKKYKGKLMATACGDNPIRLAYIFTDATKHH